MVVTCSKAMNGSVWNSVMVFPLSCFFFSGFFLDEHDEVVGRGYLGLRRVIGRRGPFFSTIELPYTRSRGLEE